MLRWSVLAIAFVINLPIAYAALVEQTTPVDALLTRLLITVPIVAVLLAGVRLAGRRTDPQPISDSRPAP